MSSALVQLIAQRIALGILLLLAVSVLIFARHADPAGRCRPIDPRPVGDAGGARQSARGARPQRSGLCPLLPLARRRPDRRSRHRAVASGQDIADSHRRAAVEHAVPRLLGRDRVGAAGDRRSACSRCATATAWSTRLISGIALASISLPEFFIGYLLIYFFAVKLQWLPSMSTVYDGMRFGERHEGDRVAGCWR